MQVQIRFYSFIRFKTGLEEIVVNLQEGGTLQDLIDRLEIEYRDELLRYLKAPDCNKLFALFIKENAILKQDAMLPDGDELRVIPAVGGG